MPNRERVPEENLYAGWWSCRLKEHKGRQAVKVIEISKNKLAVHTVGSSHVMATSLFTDFEKLDL